MDQILQRYAKRQCKPEVPVIRTGYQVKVHQKIKEGNKERVQVFQGIVIAVHNGHGINDTFTVRKISEGIGVEKVFPIHSPSIVKIEVLRAHKVKQANIGFLRGLSGKALRLKEVPLDLEMKQYEQPVEETAEEAPTTEEAAAPQEAPTEDAKAEEPKEEEKA